MVKTILHHLGLGDQIMLNGMVRHFAETDNVVIFAKRCHERDRVIDLQTDKFVYKPHSKITDNKQEFFQCP
jgi:hypothetical protein